MKGATLNYENYFFLNNSTISGIISVDGGYSINYAPIKTIGVGYNKQVIAEVPVANFSINKYLLYNEPFLAFTGENNDKTAIGFKGSLNYNNKKFGFLSGYLNSFGLSCSVGEIPTTKSDIVVYGDVGPNYDASGDLKAPYISVPQVKDIILTCSGSSTNRITNFDYNINTDPGPNYVPYEVLLNSPIEIDASFTLEVDDYTSKLLYSQLDNDTDASFSIVINGTVFEDQVLQVSNQNLTVNGGTDLLMYRKAVGINMFNQSFNNVKLVSQEFNSNADDILSVKLNYKGYLNN